MKVCSKCKIEKPLDNFRIRKDRKTGYRSDCKECEYKYSQLNRKEYFNKYQRDRRKTDSLYKMTWNIRTSISQSFLRTCNGKFVKKNKTQEILGCSFEFFLNFISSQFKDGMSLERFSEIHLDHIIPISSAKTEEEIIKLNHYTNFQPLWASDNFKKGNKIIEKQLKLI
jgi:hypothetical protein